MREGGEGGPLPGAQHAGWASPVGRTCLGLQPPPAVEGEFRAAGVHPLEAMGALDGACASGDGPGTDPARPPRRSGVRTLSGEQENQDE